MSDRSVFHLGIIGGCMSHQIDVPYPRLYHRQMAARLKAETGVRLRVRIARAFELDYPERLESLLARQSVDAVMLHVRVVFTQRARVIVANHVDGMTSYYLHPHFLRREPRTWKQIEAERFRGCLRIHRRAMPQAPGELWDAPQDASTWRGGFQLRDLTYLAGWMLGLDRRAIADELATLDQFRQACQGVGLPFIVLGPTPAPGSFWSKRLCQRMDDRLRGLLDEWQVPLSTFSATTGDRVKNLVQGDGIHLTVAGHAHVAEILHPHVKTLAEGAHP